MMATLVDTIGYLCEHYPHKGELSKARLTKMVYLADWKSVLENAHQISNIEWTFNHYGPYVEDVINTAKNDANFQVISEINTYGDFKERIELKTPRAWKSLNDKDISSLDHVIAQTRTLYWKDFIKLVYSTFPVVVSERHSKLDLPALAQRYRKDVNVST